VISVAWAGMLPILLKLRARGRTNAVLRALHERILD
jgi:hypothetical protein